MQRQQKQREPVETIMKERPYALSAIQTQILYDIASMLEDQGKTLIDFYEKFSKTFPVGVFDPLTVPVTAINVVLEPSNTRTMPWTTCTLYNDGPDAVYPRINDGKAIQTRTPLNPGEHITINLGIDKITLIVLGCLPGTTASVRIFAVK